MKTKEKAKLFAFGFGSILTMFPHLPAELDQYDIDETKSVTEGLASHWENVGSYFTTVIGRYERNAAEHTGKTA